MAGPVKQVVTVNFSKGANTKIDPLQLPPSEFINLTNSTFDVIGANEKRNGYEQLGTLAPGTANLATLSGGLISLGPTVQEYSPALSTWETSGSVFPATLSIQSLAKPNYSGEGVLSGDSCPNGPNPTMYCTVWTASSSISGGFCLYQITDAVTGANLSGAVTIASSTVFDCPKVFFITGYFIVMYMSSSTLKYISIPTATPSSPNAPVTISSSSFGGGLFDAVSSGTVLYISWMAASAGLHIINLNASLTLSSPVAVTGTAPSSKSGCMTTVLDAVNSNVFYVFSQDTVLYYCVYTTAQVLVLAKTSITSSNPIYMVTGSVLSGVLTVIYQFTSTYTLPDSGSNPVSYILLSRTCTTGGTVSGATTQWRGVCIASKSIVVNGSIYLIAAFIGIGAILFGSNSIQPTYFLLDLSNHIAAKIAPLNATGEINLQSTSGSNFWGVLPSLYLDTNALYFAYMINYGLPILVGINGAILALSSPLGALEAEQSLFITGAVSTTYDKRYMVEQNFNVFPEGVILQLSPTTGSMTTQTYLYQVTYEWNDANGLTQRSTPSPIVSQALNSGSNTSIDISIPTLRLSAKTAVTITIYRASSNQSGYLPINIGIAIPLNDPTVDFISVNDTLSDPQLLAAATTAKSGFIYTTGGVLADTSTPMLLAPSVYDERVWGLMQEDRRTLWFSKTLVEGEPVEFSQNQTYFVAPLTNKSGDIYGAFKMDDKFILFEEKELAYFNGTGPAPTGVGSSYSEPILITSPVGCTNFNSILSTDKGIFFQANANGGIWLLGRDLSVRYIGLPAAQYNSANVLSAQLIPGKTQAKFHMDNGIVIMYDFLVDQWEFDTNEQGDFGSSSVIYNNLHTYLDSNGQVQQETPGQYLDQGNTINRVIETAWIKLSGLQGYQRAYWFNMLGTYTGQHQLQVQINYDYGLNPAIGPQLVTINPTSATGEEWKVDFEYQECNSFQLVITEIANQANPSSCFTLSGLEITAGFKKGYRPFAATNQTG